ncbi:50S ribosomal protein L17 [Spiroplasma endosymbiont of Amphibalanus improvisus]|uniref:50S ribosomal protein L17 n=1 Tax=Spiroplasma endosymbiont of Amphibalanus improvisus TaxID=3066327 RepID=UPI00313E3E52
MSYIQKRGKNTSWRQSLIRNLASELIVHERLEITSKRAKELRIHVEKLVTLAKRGDLHARRQAAAFLRNINVNEEQTVLQKLFTDIAVKFKDRQGGYTRIIKSYDRLGDNAEMSIIEFTF